MSTKPHILFVCGRNLMRSPTAARLYANDPRVEVRSAGVSEASRHQLDRKDLAWADLILVMERKYAARLRKTFRDLDLPPVESLEIPDEFAFMDGELVRLIREGTESALALRFGLDAHERAAEGEI
jgi:predicted protein tyrosine phosphatase